MLAPAQLRAYHYALPYPEKAQIAARCNCTTVMVWMFLAGKRGKRPTELQARIQEDIINHYPQL
jgi:hypothetical protein